MQSWTLPKEILDRFEDMSNSGGSWGPDGFLYLTGHDPAELYKMRLPKAGSVLELVEIIPMNIRGQGIAWDRSQPGVIYGIIRATARERAAGIGQQGDGLPDDGEAVTATVLARHQPHTSCRHFASGHGFEAPSSSIAFNRVPIFLRASTTMLRQPFHNGYQPCEPLSERSDWAIARNCSEWRVL